MESLISIVTGLIKYTSEAVGVPFVVCRDLFTTTDSESCDAQEDCYIPIAVWSTYLYCFYANSDFRVLKKNDRMTV